MCRDSLDSRDQMLGKAAVGQHQPVLVEGVGLERRQRAGLAENTQEMSATAAQVAAGAMFLLVRKTFPGSHVALISASLA